MARNRDKKKYDTPEKLEKHRLALRKWRAANPEKVKASSKKYYWNNPEPRRAYIRRPDVRARARARARQVGADRMAIINKIKIDNGCAQCGFNQHPSALQFDHIDPMKKRADVGVLLWKFVPMEQVLAEISKCRILCANCHSIKTAVEGDRNKGKERRKLLDDGQGVFVDPQLRLF